MDRIRIRLVEQVFNNGFYYCYVVRCLKPHAPTFIIYLAEKKKLKTLKEIYIYIYIPTTKYDNY